MIPILLACIYVVAVFIIFILAYLLKIWIFEKFYTRIVCKLLFLQSVYKDTRFRKELIIRTLLLIELIK